MARKTIEEILAMEKVKPRAHNSHEESDIQIACVSWFTLAHRDIRILFFSVPNGGLRSKKTAAIMKSEGMTKGVSDFILLKRNKWYDYLCIEVKNPKGKQEPEQKEFERAVNMSGGKYVIVRSFDEFRKLITDYLNDGRLDKDT